MEWLFISAAASAVISNAAASVYIFRTFDVTVHVFGLLFVDAVFATGCGLASLIVDLVSGDGGVSGDYLASGDGGVSGDYVHCNLSFVFV
jgi:hypothetical protein